MKKYKKKIKEKGLKMSWIAEQLGISAPSLTMYLNESRTMPYDIEIRLKNLLK
jgi:predicted transcriptional regulator